jgi:hypothetical protein
VRTAAVTVSHIGGLIGPGHGSKLDERLQADLDGILQEKPSNFWENSLDSKNDEGRQSPYKKKISSRMMGNNKETSFYLNLFTVSITDECQIVQYLGSLSHVICPCDLIYF